MILQTYEVINFIIAKAIIINNNHQHSLWCLVNFAVDLINNSPHSAYKSIQ